MAKEVFEFRDDENDVDNGLSERVGGAESELNHSAVHANPPVTEEDSTAPQIDAHSQNHRVVSPGSEQDRGPGVNESESNATEEGDKLIYAQSDVDRFQKDAQEVVDQQVKRAEIAEKDAAEKQRQIEEILSRQRHREELVGKAGEMVGDGSYARLHALIAKFVDEQIKAERAKMLEEELTGAKEQYKMVEKWYNDALAKNKDLARTKEELDQKLNQTNDLFLHSAEANKQMQAEIDEFKILRRRCTGAIIPPCLSSLEWFVSFFEELQGEMNNDPVFDPAILVLSSLAEFAVMERNPAATCFDWRKQLLDIGLVVANYMHQKKVPESESLKLLKNFASALQSSETVARLKIELFIPSLGSDFNIERVKHVKGGTSVAKVINWGVLEPNGPYAKAIVE